MNWPYKVAPIELAKAGFMWLNNGTDCCQCVFCYGKVDKWKSDDIPLSEHAKHFPRCPFVLGFPVDGNNVDEYMEICYVNKYEIRNAVPKNSL